MRPHIPETEGLAPGLTANVSSEAVSRVRPRRRPGENRDRLLSAGLREFGVNGFRGASTSHIAARAGVPQPHLYANFSSKADLLLACAELAAAQLRDLDRRAATRAQVSESSLNLGPPGEPSGAGERVTVEDLARFVFQMVAAAGDREVGERVTPLLRALRAQLGEDAFQQLILRGADFLVTADGSQDES